MALVKCKECGAAVSTQAAACPKCGAPPPPPPPLSAKPTKRAVRQVGGALALIISVFLVTAYLTRQDPATAQAVPAMPSDDPQRKARLTSAGLVAGLLRMSMKDPEAFVLTSLVVMPDGAACYRYRAKNSYGAVLPSRAVQAAGGGMMLEENDGDAFRQAWGIECVGTGEEIAPQVNRAIEQSKR